MYFYESSAQGFTCTKPGLGGGGGARGTLQAAGPAAAQPSHAVLFLPDEKENSLSPGLVVFKTHT